MRRKGYAPVLFLALYAGIFISVIASAQPTDPRLSATWWTLGTPLQAPQDRGLYEEQYPAIITVEGTVLKLEDMPGVRGSEQMRLKTPRGETWVVFLGPRWFVDNQRLRINVGDQVEVRGAKVLYEGADNIIAADVSKGNLTMRLRNDDGLPSWDCCFPRASRK